MAEYVKRSKVMRICEDYSQHCFNSNDAYGQEIADRILDDVSILPAADVVEVKHGYWYICEYEYFSCSECGNSYYNACESTAQAKEILRSGDTYNYCPNCGAKMDGEKKG